MTFTQLRPADLDRTNLGNARLQGLPQDVLHGDPTGVLFDWVNSAFFFSYVSTVLLSLRSPFPAFPAFPSFLAFPPSQLRKPPLPQSSGKIFIPVPAELALSDECPVTSHLQLPRS